MDQDTKKETGNTCMIGYYYLDTSHKRLFITQCG